MTNEQLLEEYNKEVFGDTPEEEHKITLEFLIQFHRAFRNHNQLEKMKPFPEKDHLRIFWQVAVTSAIEGQGEPYEIFARQLYHYFAGTYDHLVIRWGDDDETED
jgi:hypothetical protein